MSWARVSSPRSWQLPGSCSQSCILPPRGLGLLAPDRKHGRAVGDLALAAVDRDPADEAADRAGGRCELGFFKHLDARVLLHAADERLQVGPHGLALIGRVDPPGVPAQLV